MTIHFRSVLLAAAALVANPALAQTTPLADPALNGDNQDVVIADRRIEPDIIVAAGVPQYTR